MSAISPFLPQFTATVSNAATPTTDHSGWGTSTPPGASNVKSSYVQVLSALGFDVCYVEVSFYNGAAISNARDIIADVGVDPAGGTTYGVLIPDLLASCAAPAGTGLGRPSKGHHYAFPLRIRSGSTVAVRASVNNATAGNLRTVIRCWGKPKRPELWRMGSFVKAIGVVAASSRGTTITPGTSAEGAWTSIGTTADRLWWWQVGMGVNDSTMVNLGYNVDLSVGDATNKHLIIEDQNYVTDPDESLGCSRNLMPINAEVPSGAELFMRIHCSGTPDVNISGAAYGVGG